MMKKNIFLIIALLFCLPFLASSQTQEELVAKARAAGVPESQIQEIVAKQNQNGENNDKSKGRIIGYEKIQRNSLDLRIDSVINLKPQKDTISIDSTIFGHDIFTNTNLTFAPNYNMPTPKNYTLSGGDEVEINIWGNSEMSTRQVITPEGRVFIEGLGPVMISGLTVENAEARVKSRLSKIYSGLEDGSSSLSLTLSQIRSITVNILGETLAPGTYTLPSLSTIFNALYIAGGVSDIGSLRSIRLYRANNLEADLDAYDYLLNGVSETNARLEDGDIIIVSPYKSLVRTTGELKRNRFYELKEGETLEQLIAMAGGFKGSAFKENVQIERKNGKYLSIKSVRESAFPSFEMADGDVVTVKPIAERYDNKISIEGAVWYPGDYELNSDVYSVKSLVEEAGGLKGDELAGRALLARTNIDFTKSIIAVDIKAIVNGTAPDIELSKDDILTVPSFFDLREEYVVKVSGAVNSENDSIPFHDNMTVEDAIILANGLKEAAATVKVDVSRRIKNSSSTNVPSKTVEVFEVTISEGLALTEDGNPLILKPFDEVYVRYSPGYREPEVVDVDGEVLFKGQYALKSVNGRLSDIIKDAGGVTSQAYVKGASLKRNLSEDEQKRLETLLELSRRNEESQDSIPVADIALTQYSIGIDLEKAINNPGGLDDVVLRDGDKLFIPKKQSTVKISGAVVYPNSVTFTKSVSAKRYIEDAGGYSDIARKRPIVVYMNGTVKSTRRVALFFKKYPKVEPGCEVLVPTKRAGDKMTTAEILSIASSTTSMAAMITSLIK